ncbi:MAG: iron ABC transporter permease [Methanomassiliicoccales archaeon]|nr:iron ABC transporter permease [Methanomassiliicoccales archaeon]
MSYIDTILNIISKKSFRKGWNAFIIFFFLVFVILPTVYILSYVFTHWSAIETNVLSDRETINIILSSIAASFEIATIVTVVDFIVGLPLAWLLVRKEFRGKRFLDTLIDMPLAVPTAALGFSSAIFWATTPPSIEAPPFALGAVSSPMLLVILLHIVFSYPYMVRSLAAILEQIDVTYEIAGQTLGASKLTAARTITLPLFRAGLVTGIILCFSRSLSETGGTMIALATMANAAGFNTGPTLIGEWKKLSVTHPELIPQLSFVSILLIIIALILLAILKVIVMKVRLPFGKVWPRPEKILSRGFAPKLKDALSLIFLLFFVLLPSFFIFSYVATASPSGGDWGGFWSSLFYSFGIAFVVTLIDLSFGIPLAFFIVRSESRKISSVLDVLVNVPLIVPTAALGFSLGQFYSDQPFIPAVPTLLIIMAHVAFTYPLVVRNVAGAIEEIDPSYEETARTLGAKPIQAFRRVLYPMIKSSILAGSIMAFTRSLGETGATQAVVSEALTAPVYIVELVKGQEYYLAGLACIALISVSYAAMLLLRYLTRKKGRSV